MVIRLNGEERETAEHCLKAVLEAEGFDLSRVVVEKNLEILSKERLESETLAEGDSVEVLSFVGGG